MITAIIKILVELIYKTLTVMIGYLSYYLNKIFNSLITSIKTWCNRNDRIEWKDINLSLNKFKLYIPYTDTSFPLTDEGCKELIEQLFNILMKNDRFRITEAYKNVGLYIEMVDGQIGRYHSLHKSIIINRNTTFEDYWKAVSQDLLDEVIDIDFFGNITFVLTIGQLTIPESKELKINNGIGKIVNKQRKLTPFKPTKLGLGGSNKRTFHTSAILNQDSYAIEQLKKSGCIVDINDKEGLQRQKDRQAQRLLRDKKFVPHLKQLMLDKYPSEFEMISKMNPTLDLDEKYLLCLHYHFKDGLIEIINSGYDNKIGKYVFEMYVNHRFNAIREDLKSLFYPFNKNLFKRGI